MKRIFNALASLSLAIIVLASITFPAGYAVITIT